MNIGRRLIAPTAVTGGARQATEAEERCTLEVPASRSPGDDVKV
ncbi:hypothetical protein [Actinacidiphila soli]|nr:hypothetical protein [Actinacidiphila soli]